MQQFPCGLLFNDRSGTHIPEAPTLESHSSAMSSSRQQVCTYWTVVIKAQDRFLKLILLLFLVTERVKSFWDALQPTSLSQTISKATWSTTSLTPLNQLMSWKKQSDQILIYKSCWPGAKAAVKVLAKAGPRAAHVAGAGVRAAHVAGARAAHVAEAGARAVHDAEAEEGAKVAHVQRVHCEKDTGLVVGIRPGSVVQHRAGAEVRGQAAAVVKRTRRKKKKGREALSPAVALTWMKIPQEVLF